MDKDEFQSSIKALVLLSILIFLCYSNTLNSPWQLDDVPGIVDNSLLHLEHLSPTSLWHTTIAQPFNPGNLYRPVANLTFALNWYLGGNNTLGFHLVNIGIHILTAFFLFKVSSLLLCSPLTQFSENDAHSIALLSAIIWAINPVQIQAVTYIIQRMASLATLFFILAILFFIRFRVAIAGQRKSLLSCFLCFLLALGCKENAITLIPVLLLIEITFFYNRLENKSAYVLGTLLILSLLFVVAGLYFLVNQGLISGFFEKTGSRPFTPFERIITQPKVLLFYLSLLFYPSPFRLSVDHHIEISQSLFVPWVTTLSIILVLGLNVFAISSIRRFPLISFAVLFFFINHLVESTLLPLEMIFEHRNYLPSLFLFLPIAAGLYRMTEYYSERSAIVFFSLGTGITFLIFSLGLATYYRNITWKSEEPLWLDAMHKAPQNARPLAKLGNINGWEKEYDYTNYASALNYYSRALEAYSPRVSFEAAIYDNIGKLHRRYGYYDQALEYYEKALTIKPNFKDTRFEIAEVLSIQGQLEQSLEKVDNLIKQKDYQSRYFNLRTILLLWLSQPEEAVKNGQAAIWLSPPSLKTKYFYNLGVALTTAGDLHQGYWFLQRSLSEHPTNFRILSSLIENRLHINDREGAARYATQLIDSYSISLLNRKFARLREDYTSVPIEVNLVYPFITDVLSQQVGSQTTSTDLP